MGGMKGAQDASLLGKRKNPAEWRTDGSDDRASPIVV